MDLMLLLLLLLFDCSSYPMTQEVSITVAVMCVTCQVPIHCPCPRGESCPQKFAAEGLEGARTRDLYAVTLEGAARLVRIRNITMRPFGIRGIRHLGWEDWQATFDEATNGLWK